MGGTSARTQCQSAKSLVDGAALIVGPSEAKHVEFVQTTASSTARLCNWQ